MKPPHVCTHRIDRAVVSCPCDDASEAVIVADAAYMAATALARLEPKEAMAVALGIAAGAAHSANVSRFAFADLAYDMAYEIYAKATKANEGPDGVAS